MSGNTSSDIWIAGAFAAFSVDLLVYPLDTIKTRIQSPDYKKLYLNEGTNTVKKAVLFRGLYQGLGSVILATLPACRSGAFFTTYEGAKSILTRYNPSSPFEQSSGHGLIPQPVLHSAASAFAELVSCAILTPAEVIKQNAQMVSKDNTADVSATMQTLKRFKNNPFALWRGYSALAGRNLPHTALQFPLYERFKVAFKSYRTSQKETNGGSGREEDLTLLENGVVTAVAAGTAGSIAAVTTTPIDVIKTRVMLQAANSFASQDQGSRVLEEAKKGEVVGAIKSITEVGYKQKQSNWSIGRDVVAEHGWKGLWRGGALRGVWTMLGSGLYLGVYETGRTYLEDRRKGISDED